MKPRMHVGATSGGDEHDKAMMRTATAKASAGSKAVMTQPPTGDERAAGKIEKPYTAAAARGAGSKIAQGQGTAGGAMGAKSPVVTKNVMKKNFNQRDYGSK
jgi:hypothetical protein